MLDHRFVQHGNARLCAVKHRDADAPRSLPRDAPVRPVPNHRVDSVLALRRNPVHAVDGREHVVPHRVDRYKPLLGRPENHRELVPLCIRIAMVEVLNAEKRADFDQSIHHHRVAGLVERAFEFARLVRQNAPLINRVGNRQTVLLAGVKVIASVGGRGVDHAGSVLGRDVVGHDRNRRPVENRVAELDAGQVQARERLEHLVVSPAKRVRDLLDERVENHVGGRFVRFFRKRGSGSPVHPHDRVVHLGMESHG